MADSAISASTVARISDLLTQEIGSSPDAEALSAILEYRTWLFFYRRRTSRDEMLTLKELAANIAVVHDHLREIVQLLSDEDDVTLWLDEFLKDYGRPEDDSFMRLRGYLDAASDAKQRFEANVNAGEVLTFTRDDGEVVEHKRKTTTDTRDRVLIPGLLQLLRKLGLDLKSNDSTWNLSALDAACEIIQLVLQDLRLPVPDAGDTMRGERGQGHLRRIVKEKWLVAER